jgi:hemerythrin-like domain-containing protein
MPESVTVPLADTSDMVQIHRVFREALSSAAPLVGSVPPGDASRAETVYIYFANVLEFLRVHHEGEDELLWSKLIDRNPGEADTIRRIAHQHEGVHEALDVARERLEAWHADPQIEHGAKLAAALATLGADLAAHLDEEERVILPIAARCLTAPEWGELPAHGMQHYGRDEIWLLLGLIQEQFTPEQNAMMESHMPPPVLDFWTGPGRQMFTEFVTRLRG